MTSYYTKNKDELNNRRRVRRKVRTEEEIKTNNMAKRRSRLRHGFTMVYYNAMKRAKRQSVTFTLPREWARVRYYNTKRSELSGIPFTDDIVTGAQCRPFARSFDRINANKGYSKENLRVICWCENMALGEFGIGVYDRMCKARIRRLLK